MTDPSTTQPTQETHTWQPQWRLWERIQTALLAIVPFLDDADIGLRDEIADLNAVLPSLRNPAVSPYNDAALLQAAAADRIDASTTEETDG